MSEIEKLAREASQAIKKMNPISINEHQFENGFIKGYEKANLCILFPSQTDNEDY